MLTASVYDPATGTFVQRSDHLHPFTTPISGFAAGDTITLAGHFVGGDDDVAVWRASTHTLSVEREPSI